MGEMIRHWFIVSTLLLVIAFFVWNFRKFYLETMADSRANNFPKWKCIALASAHVIVSFFLMIGTFVVLVVSAGYFGGLKGWGITMMYMIFFFWLLTKIMDSTPIKAAKENS